MYDYIIVGHSSRIFSLVTLAVWYYFWVLVLYVSFAY